jgi:hexulose-6-phosphate isomerase
MSPTLQRIGFMQGRLSPLVNGMIQAFPAEHWREEFQTAARLGFACMEWTLDQEQLHANPLLTSEGQAEILQLSARHGVAVCSITGDCFMQAPYWKAGSETLRDALLDDFRAVVRGAAAVGATIVVVPLVDNGSLTCDEDERRLLAGLVELAPILSQSGIRLAFESDFAPNSLAELTRKIPVELGGVNLDIGNSASLGWAPEVEIPLLASRIINVHVKDRPRGGTTVPLGEGDADLAGSFALLKSHGYPGRYILQTARDAGGDHAGAAARYRRMTAGWMEGL